MRERVRHPSFVGPLILITIGVLLLLNQMGRLHWDILWSLWRYWPVILILLGIEALVGASESRLVHLLGLLVALVIFGGLIGYVVLQGGATPAQRPATDTETFTQGLQDADRGLVALRMAGGALTVGALSDSPNLVEGKIEYSARSQRAEQRMAVKNGRAEFELRGRQDASTWVQGTDSGERWQVGLTPRVPLEMTVDLGAGSVEADLSGLQVTALKLNVGAGSVKLTLPAVNGTAAVSVELPVGSVNVVVPAGVGVKIRANKLLSSVNIAGRGFTRSGNEWVSTNYSTATSKVDLRIDNVIGSINVR